jgi:hypothetical protein
VSLFSSTLLCTAGSTELQHRQSKTVVITGLRAADFSLGLLELRLAQFNDGAQTQFVPCPRQVEGKIAVPVRKDCR